MDKRFIEMKDGAKIFTMVYDGGFEKSIILIHGGPGASCDYFKYQADLLSKHMNVVLFDERGVRRSDPINPEHFAFQVLIDDIDEIRESLNIKKWSVVGHSFGGLLAFLYSIKYQNNVEKAILECPTFNYKDSSDFTNLAIINKLKIQGYNDLADEMATVMTDSGVYSDNVFDKIPGHIITEIYHPFPRHPIAAEMTFQESFTDDENDKTKVHCKLVITDSEANENHLLKLKSLNVPSLLLLGEYDVVCSPLQQEAFEKEVKNGKTIILPNCGHTLHNEIPQLFVDSILKFINANFE